MANRIEGLRKRGQAATLTLLTLLTTPALSAPAADPVSAHELQAAVAKLHRKADEQAARQILNLELNERLSTAMLARLQAQLPGEQSRRALIAVADASAFLGLPVEDLPAAPAPILPEQKLMLARTADYLAKTIPTLPDLIATEDTLHFSDAPAPDSRPSATGATHRKLHFEGESSATVGFSASGGEFADSGVDHANASQTGKKLAVEGVFGPIFAVVRKDVLTGNPSWSRWETGPRGPMAVFRYQVAKEKSHYVVQDSGGAGILAPVAAYHGEMAVDPETGAILRVTLQAALRAGGPVLMADLAVEYGPVEIAGATFICPTRSVAVSRARDLNPLEGLYMYPLAAQAPVKLEVNDAAYSRYHLFRAQLHVMAPENEGSSEKPPAPAPNR